METILVILFCGLVFAGAAYFIMDVEVIKKKSPSELYWEEWDRREKNPRVIGDKSIPARFKAGDRMKVWEGNNRRMEDAVLISDPVWRVLFQTETWWYQVMTESRTAAEGTECIGSGSITRRPHKNELFQFYYENPDTLTAQDRPLIHGQLNY